MAGEGWALCRSGRQGRALWGEDRLAVPHPTGSQHCPIPCRKPPAPAAHPRIPFEGGFGMEPSSAPALRVWLIPGSRAALRPCCALPAQGDKQPVPRAPGDPSSATGGDMPPLPHPEISHRHPEPRSNEVTSQEPPQRPGSERFPLQILPALSFTMNTHFCLLHSFPRTVSIQWKLEWCFSLFFLRASKPWSARACSVFVLPRGFRALQMALKAHFPLPQKGLKAAEAGQGSQNIVFHSVPFYLYTHCFARFELFGALAGKGKAGGSEGRARGRLIPFTLGKCPGCHSTVPQLCPGCFLSGCPASSYPLEKGLIWDENLVQSPFKERGF